MMAAADLFLVAIGATPSQRPEAIRLKSGFPNLGFNKVQIWVSKSGFQ